MSVLKTKNVLFICIAFIPLLLSSCKEDKLVFKGTAPVIFPGAKRIEGKGFITSMPTGENRSAEYFETDKSVDEVREYYMNYLQMNEPVKNEDFPLCEYFVVISTEKKTIIKIESSKCF